MFLWEFSVSDPRLPPHARVSKTKQACLSEAAQDSETALRTQCWYIMSNVVALLFWNWINEKNAKRINRNKKWEERGHSSHLPCIGSPKEKHSARLVVIELTRKQLVLWKNIQSTKKFVSCSVCPLDFYYFECLPVSRLFIVVLYIFLVCNRTSFLSNIFGALAVKLTSGHHYSARNGYEFAILSRLFFSTLAHSLQKFRNCSLSTSCGQICWNTSSTLSSHRLSPFLGKLRTAVFANVRQNFPQIQYYRNNFATSISKEHDTCLRRTFTENAFTLAQTKTLDALPCSKASHGNIVAMTERISKLYELLRVLAF